ncbi:hypothetical protein SK629_0822 [Streptococcus mitis]|jgi:hypothetical protein|uniref:Phage protein n=1 Tax=Streptococcus mitis TaxID=28037 RepID=A0A081PX91_STRMT|nr:hypothetical protein [Streptococcus mitis]KEQ35314.1 hypothetical protein SK629_0822 [Streptococcus mitis]
MKIKLFYHHFWESKEEFEQEVNDFMATVEVVDVRHSEATEGHYESIGALTSVMVLYK